MVKKIAYVLLAVLLLLVVGIASLVRFDIPPEQLMAKYAAPPSKFLDVGSLKVHYRDEGQGFPLVLLHGAGSSLHTWDGWTRELAKSYRVIRLDLPGFGLTGPNAKKDYSMAWNVRFLAASLDKLGVTECYVAGNSYGGRMAWEFASARPKRVRKLILLDASGYPMPQRRILAVRLARMPLVGRLLLHVTPRFLMAKTLRDMYGDPTRLSEATIDRYYDLFLRAGNRETFRILSRERLRDPSARIRTIKAPTLILWGAADQGVPLANAERFHGDIQGSKLIVYPGVGHVPMEEIPDQSSRDAGAFLAAQ
jgi:pimeloyl-ACP methyl ester carboxylesterase